MEFDRAVDRERVIKGEDLGQKGDIQVHAIRFLVLHSLTHLVDIVSSPCTVLMQWTPDWPFLARTTRSLAERNMYLVPPTVTPFIASWSVLEYLIRGILVLGHHCDYYWFVTKSYYIRSPSPTHSFIFPQEGKLRVGVPQLEI